MTAILSLTAFVKVFGLVKQGGLRKKCMAKARFILQALLHLLPK